MERGAAILTAIALLFSVTGCEQQETRAARQLVVHANNAFSTALYQALSSEPGNLVMSPISVEVVMAMAWLGAGGETARELAEGLRLPESRSQVEQGFKTLLSSLQSTSTVTLDIANKLFIKQGFQVKDTFHRTAVDNFHSDAEEVDFSNNTEGVRRSINQWVEEKTRQKIKDLIEQGTLSEETLMVIVNAIYFKGDWRNPFPEENTAIEPFSLTPGSNVDVHMMHQTSHFLYGEVSSLNTTAIRLPYHNEAEGGATQSMLILLPDEIDGLSHLESQITSLNLTHLMRTMDTTEVILSLPRFKVEKTLKLTDTLKKLGIQSLFKPGANLSGITDENVFVDKVIQKAFVEVTEKGTEAAAATFSDIFNEMLVIPVEFKAHHPFLFMILDDNTEAILFAGRVVDPS